MTISNQTPTRMKTRVNCMQSNCTTVFVEDQLLSSRLILELVQHEHTPSISHERGPGIPDTCWQQMDHSTSQFYVNSCPAGDDKQFNLIQSYWIVKHHAVTLIFFMYNVNAPCKDDVLQVASTIRLGSSQKWWTSHLKSVSEALRIAVLWMLLHRWSLTWNLKMPPRKGNPY